MIPHYELIHLDCRQGMRLCMAANSIDSAVMDPPYDLTSIVKRFGKSDAAPCQYGTDGAYARASRGFMGQQWDGTGVAFDPDTWREVWRVLKPGAHLLAFGGTRTYHRMAVAIEDAGFEIRDQLAWIYGSGFPKSHNVAKQLRKMDSAQADEWEGWGTALKPALEPIVMARKPLVGSVAGNVLVNGTGAINIDGCRIRADDAAYIANCSGDRGHADNRSRDMDFALGCGRAHDAGRFPANLIHDGSPDVMDIFPSEAGAATAVRGDEPSSVTNGIYGHFADRVPGAFYADSGSAARFFYCAKASKSDREEGLIGLPLQAAGMTSDHSGAHITRREEGYEPPQRANHHPTVKPTALMRYLVRLVTPPGGTVLDPFAGSGSTGKAALLEGFNFIGCEMTPEYIPIAEARLAHALQFWAERHPA